MFVSHNASFLTNLENRHKNAKKVLYNLPLWKMQLNILVRKQRWQERWAVAIRIFNIGAGVNTCQSKWPCV